MNKQILTIIFVIGLLFSAVPVMAATSFSFSPTTVNVTEGNNFTVSVASDPYGVANFTTKMVVSFPADLIEVQSFSMGDAWMPLIQPGYNLIDNTNGSLIKTGGYTNGYSSVVNFGTITFHTKKAGTGVIKMGNGSVSYDTNNKNVIGTSSSQVALVVSAIPAITTPVKPVVTTPVKPAITTPVKPAVTKPVVEQPVKQPVVEQPVVTAPVEQPVSTQASFLSALGNFLNFRICMLGIFFLFLLLLAFILGYLTRVCIERKRKWKK